MIENGIKDFRRKTDFPHHEIERNDDDKESVEIMRSFEEENRVWIHDQPVTRETDNDQKRQRKCQGIQRQNRSWQSPKGAFLVDVVVLTAGCPTLEIKTLMKFLEKPHLRQENKQINWPSWYLDIRHDE